MSDQAAADGSTGVRALAVLRAATADICDVIPLGAPDDFQVLSTTKLVGGCLLVESVSTPLEYHRTPVHVARGGLDHYQINLCLRGQMKFTSSRRELTLRPGDICLVDMEQPNWTELTGEGDDRCRLMSLIVPRHVLAPRLAYPDSATATFLPESDRRARLLADQFASLWQQPESDSETAETVTTVETMRDMIAEVAGRSADARGTVGRAERQLLLAAIKHHIDANIETGSLSADDLGRRFHLSRASLYRLFGADGGLARYVQDRRLNRALRLLIAPGARGKRLIDLAVDLQFSGDSTFVRAFRRQFGMTPGEIRDMSEAWAREMEKEAPDDLFHRLARR